MPQSRLWIHLSSSWIKLHSFVLCTIFPRFLGFREGCVRKNVDKTKTFEIYIFIFDLVQVNLAQDGRGRRHFNVRYQRVSLPLFYFCYTLSSPVANPQRTSALSYTETAFVTIAITEILCRRDKNTEAINTCLVRVDNGRRQVLTECARNFNQNKQKYHTYFHAPPPELHSPRNKHQAIYSELYNSITTSKPAGVLAMFSFVLFCSLRKKDGMEKGERSSTKTYHKLFSVTLAATRRRGSFLQIRPGECRMYREVHGGLETSACRSDITKHPPEWNVI